MRLKTDTLGRKLNLDWMTREQLRLWQIGAVDAPADHPKQWTPTKNHVRAACTRVLARGK